MTENRSTVRLNKYISECGVCSRRQADSLIAKGRVFVNGAPAKAGMQISSSDTVMIGEKEIVPDCNEIVIAVNKPAGYVCTEAHFKNEKTLSSLIDLPVRVFSIGRLDKESEGLILMTNNGELADAVGRGSNHHEKEYEVKVDRPVTFEFLEEMRSGVSIEIDGKIYRTRPCRVKKTNADSFNIILTQGMNRQIRRMCSALGYRVRHLRRIRVMNVLLGGIEPGKYRQLSETEVGELKAALKKKK